MRYNAKAELYRYVNWLRSYLGITPYDCSVDVLSLCRQEGTTDIIYRSFETDGFCGAAFVGDTTDTIVLNSLRSTAEQNFDCGHEVIHLTKHRDRNDGMFNCFSKGQDSFLEWEANEGAAEFIVSNKIFIPDVASAYPYFSSYSSIISFKHDMVQKYHATSAMIDFRLESLKYEIYQYLNGVTLDDIAYLSRREQQRKNIQIESVIDLENSMLMSCWNSTGA